MRTLASFHFMSLDGVVESPDQFVHEGLFEDIVAAITLAVHDQDGVLLGRTLYEEWSDYWPQSTIEPFASFINPVRKHVVSNSLEKVAWHNATLLSGDLAEGVARLKGEDSGTLCVRGSVALSRSLLTLGLIDELRLVVFPVLAGSGRRLIEPGDAKRDLTLTENYRTPKGVQYLVYRVAR